MLRPLFFIVMLFVVSVVGADIAFAEDGAHGGNAIAAIGAGLAVGLAVLGCGLGQGKGLSSALDSIGRNPGAAGKLFVPMIIGLVFIELLGILSFVIANKIAGTL